MDSFSLEKKKSIIGFFIVCYLAFFINTIELFAIKTGYLGRASFVLFNIIGMAIFFILYIKNFKSIYYTSISKFFLLNVIFFIYVIINGLINKNITRLIYGGYQYILYYFIFFTVYIFIDKNKIDTLLKYILSFNFINSIFLIYEFITKKNILNTTDFGQMAFEGTVVIRAKAFFGSFLNGSIVLCVVTLISLYYLIEAINKKNKKNICLYSVFIITYLGGIFATGSRGPLVALGSGVLFFIIAYSLILSENKRKSIIIITIITLAIIMILLIILRIDVSSIDNKLFSFIIHRIQSIFNWTSDQGNVERIQSWKFAFSLIETNPIFGVGIASTGAKGVGSFAIGVTESGFLKRFAEMGIVGLLLSYLIYIAIIKEGIKKILSSTINRNKKVLLLILVSAIIAILVEEFIYQATEAEVVSFYLWMIGAIIFSIESESKELLTMKGRLNE